MAQLNFFQMFCDKPLDSKCVDILLPYSNIINDLFDLPDLDFSIKEDDEKAERYLIDR